MGLLSQPRLQAHDVNGVPLAGAKLYTYDSGTSTPKVTYNNLALSIPLSNPIIADAEGVFAAIFYDGAAKLELKDADDVLVWTTDEVSTSGLGAVVDDTNPTLGGNLNTNGFSLTVGTDDVLKFVDVPTAVNEITLTNAAAGNSPAVNASGDDANVDLTLGGKGTGKVVVLPSTTQAGEIRLKENTANGTNYMGIKAPEAVTGNTTLTLPDGAGANGQVLSTNGVGTMTWQYNSITQHLYLVDSTNIASSGNIPTDNTIPQITEGTSCPLTLAVTPKIIGSRLVVEAQVNVNGTSAASCQAALFKSSQNDALVAANEYGGSSRVPLYHEETTVSLDEITFSVRFSVPSGGDYNPPLYGTAGKSMIKITEYVT